MSLFQTACSLQKLGQPIQDRFTEAEERPKAFEELGKQIQQYMKFVEACKIKVKGKKNIFIHHTFLCIH